MKKIHFPIILGLCAAGFLFGFAGKRLTSGPRPAAVDTAGMAATKTTAVAEGETTSAAASSKSAKPVAPRLSTLHSTDTLESLAALKGDALYARLALWLLDASEPEIAAYWASVKDQKNRKNEITDLVFINWTRLDSRAAIAAVAGTDTEHHAWWAWACHDPKGALAAAIAANPDRVNNVAWGIGEFHGDWLLAHFNEIPESGRDNAISGLTKWDDCPDPLAILDFLKKNGDGFNQNIFNSLIRKDPWAAYDWIKNNTATVTSNYGSQEAAIAALVKSMGESQPDALQRLADQTPPGEAKRKMEAALFENLLKTDPDAALEQAKATLAPRIAAERLAAVGLSLYKTDPEKGFEMASSLFSIYPDAMEAITWVRSPNNSSGSGETIEGVDQLVNALIAKDPARLVAMQDPTSTSFSSLTQKWAERDLAAYTNWVNQQTDPATRDQAAGVVINQLQSEQQYSEALDWAMSSEKNKADHLHSLLINWKQVNPDEAVQWLQSSNLPETEKNQLIKTLERVKSGYSNDPFADPFAEP